MSANGILYEGLFCGNVHRLVALRDQDEAVFFDRSLMHNAALLRLHRPAPARPS